LKKVSASTIRTVPGRPLPDMDVELVNDQDGVVHHDVLSIRDGVKFDMIYGM